MAVPAKCRWRRHSYDRTFVFELTEMPTQKIFLATVHHKGLEIAHRYYDYTFEDIQNRDQAWDKGLAWCYGIQDFYDGLLTFDLIEEEERG